MLLVVAVLAFLGFKGFDIAKARAHQQVQQQQVAIHAVGDVKHRHLQRRAQAGQGVGVGGQAHQFDFSPQHSELRDARADLAQALEGREQVQVVLQILAQPGMQPVAVFASRAQRAGLAQCGNRRWRRSGVARDHAQQAAFNRLRMPAERLQHLLDGRGHGALPSFDVGCSAGAGASWPGASPSSRACVSMRSTTSSSDSCAVLSAMKPISWYR